MGVSKVEFGGKTLIDLTNDNVSPETLKKGVYAHDAAGNRIIGTMEGGGGDYTPPFPVQKVAEYLYYIEAPEDTDYEYGNRWADLVNGGYLGCSSLRKGKYVGRNLDHYFLETAEFVVRTKPTKGRYASIGIATGLPQLTNEFANSGEWSDLYKIIPLGLVDGINEKGVTCSIHVLDNPNAVLPAEGSNPDADVNLNILTVVKVVMDRASTVAEAFNIISNSNILPAPNGYGTGYQFFIADKTKNYIVEYINDNGTLRWGYDECYEDGDNITRPMPIMTNFSIYEWGVNKQYIGAGMERHMMLVGLYPELCEGVRFIEEAMRSVWVIAGTDYHSINRDGRNVTVHTSIYDIEKKSLVILPQAKYNENNTQRFEFYVNDWDYGVSNDLQVNIWTEVIDHNVVLVTDSGTYNKIMGRLLDDDFNITFTIDFLGISIVCKNFLMGTDTGVFQIPFVIYNDYTNMMQHYVILLSPDDSIETYADSRDFT